MRSSGLHAMQSLFRSGWPQWKPACEPGRQQSNLGHWPEKQLRSSEERPRTGASKLRRPAHNAAHGSDWGTSVKTDTIEEALRISEARNRDLVRNSVYGIFRATVDGRFLDTNPALLSILGCSRAEDLGRLNLVREVYRFPDHYALHLADCRTRGHVHGAETEWRRRDGGIVAVRLNLRHVSTSDEPETIEYIAEDVTELRAMEKQLRQAQKFEAIGELAGGVAHDFNNVVGAILGWAELGYEENRGNAREAERYCASASKPNAQPL